MDAEMATHPGEVLKQDYLLPWGLSANRFAQSMGMQTNRITEIINSVRGISPKTAILLGQACSTTPEFWLSLQARYDIDIAKSGPSFAKQMRAVMNVVDR
jgi:antitoxin HigA-1